MKTRILALAAAALFLAAFAASAQTGTWTAVGSTGTVDPAMIGMAGVFGGTNIGFSPTFVTTPATLMVRFNVTNTFGGGMTDIMPWTTLEVGAVSTAGGSVVAATLYRVDRCTGRRTPICTASNTSAGSSGFCVPCTFPAGTVNFGANLYYYYVEVMIGRPTTGGNPQLTTLRIF